MQVIHITVYTILIQYLNGLYYEKIVWIYVNMARNRYAYNVFFTKCIYCTHINNYFSDTRLQPFHILLKHFPTKTTHHKKIPS